MKFVDPKVDIAFKKIFGDVQRKHVLISFLNAVLDQDIVEVEILNPYQVPKIPELKFTILDVRAKDRDGRSFIVEMQANPYKYFDKRALHYVSKAYVNQLKSGKDYKDHEPVYFIGVLNFNFFNSKHYLSCHLIQNIETQEQEIRDFEFYFLELKKFNKTLPELSNTLDKWTYFLKRIEAENEIPAPLAAVPAIEAAAQTANQATWTPDELDAYEHGLREEQRELDMIEELKENAKTISAQVKALKKKDQAMHEQGGTLKKSIQLLLTLGKSPSEIAKALNLSETEVEKFMD